MNVRQPTSLPQEQRTVTGTVLCRPVVYQLLVAAVTDVSAQQSEVYMPLRELGSIPRPLSLQALVTIALSFLISMCKMSWPGYLGGAMPAFACA